jgi:hypothetical protein
MRCGRIERREHRDRDDRLARLRKLLSTLPMQMEPEEGLLPLPAQVFPADGAAADASYRT